MMRRPPLWLPSPASHLFQGPGHIAQIHSPLPSWFFNFFHILFRNSNIKQWNYDVWPPRILNGIKVNCYLLRNYSLTYYSVIHCIQRYWPSDSTEEGAINSSWEESGRFLPEWKKEAGLQETICALSFQQTYFPGETLSEALKPQVWTRLLISGSF